MFQNVITISELVFILCIEYETKDIHSHKMRLTFEQIEWIYEGAALWFLENESRTVESWSCINNSDTDIQNVQ